MKNTNIQWHSEKAKITGETMMAEANAYLLAQYPAQSITFDILELIVLSDLLDHLDVKTMFGAPVTSVSEELRFFHGDVVNRALEKIELAKDTSFEQGSSE